VRVCECVRRECVSVSREGVSMGSCECARVRESVTACVCQSVQAGGTEMEG
jgi:hypothetical protein